MKNHSIEKLQAQTASGATNYLKIPVSDMQCQYKGHCLIPVHYTDREGGPWLEWCSGEILKNVLDARDSKAVIINAVKVHSLMFVDFEWDCINGVREYTR